MNQRLVLEMPSADLSPNARLHYMYLHRARKKAKNYAMLMARAANIEPFSRYHLHFIFPDNRRRDIDNFVARCKAYLDGIAGAVDQDDSSWGMDAPTREIIKEKSNLIITLTK